MIVQNPVLIKKMILHLTLNMVMIVSLGSSLLM